MTAVIPVRAGSRRLKNKNILPFGDSNLLVHKIRQLKQVSNLDKIVVSSDSEKMLQMAIDEGVDIHRRQIEYADEKTKTFGEVVAYIAHSIQDNDIMWSPCVCPLVNSTIYSDAINEYKKNIPDCYDSLMSMQILKIFLWNDNGPINYELGLKHVPSQQLPNIYQMINGMFIAPRSKMIEWKYFHGPNPYKFIIDKAHAIDIDDELDLEAAKAYHKLLETQQ